MICKMDAIGTHPSGYASGFAAAVGVLLLGVSLASAEVTPGTTRPSEERSLAFPNAGVIAERDVRDGDVVSAGQVLMRQDVREPRQRLEALRVGTDVQRLRVSAAEAQLAQARVDLKRTEQLFKQRVASDSELERARLEVDLAAAQVEVSKGQVRESEVQASVQEVVVEQGTLLSPIDGIVTGIEIGPGEFATPNPERPTVRIVKNDPLYVDVKNLPAERVARMAVGQTLGCRYPDESEQREATIIFVAPVADAMSGTREIRLQLPNPEGRAAGLNLDVLVDDVVAAGR